MSHFHIEEVANDFRKDDVLLLSTEMRHLWDTMTNNWMIGLKVQRFRTSRICSSNARTDCKSARTRSASS